MEDINAAQNGKKMKRFGKLREAPDAKTKQHANRKWHAKQTAGHQ